MRTKLSTCELFWPGPWSVSACTQIPALPPVNCLISGKVLNISMPQFPYL